ncbi:hypothetical protein MNBD_GAMMA25-693 [hydrothermal vent metagenome]|uniref:Uncharacterized protein n=1 Tax=hydrothermal vent metagenome TaxID=652676 RepID=A0A3B1B3Z2_9ZZZZ
MSLDSRYFGRILAEIYVRKTDSRQYSCENDEIETILKPAGKS